MSYYLCIDLKSFYASVECVERGLDPMTTNLVVADPERSEKTICLAVSPSMKALGVHNRCRVFEIPKHIKYIMAPPRMKKYVEYAADIYSIYLEYVSKNDIHVYSIDEVFIDITKYLTMYKTTVMEIAKRLIDEVYNRLGIRSTCGIGTNLYLAKIALDIKAKDSENFIGYLDEDLFQKMLWNHRPLTDFWRIGRATAKKLESKHIYTMKDIAFADEDELYHIFGVDAELLIDHAWGRESATIADIKAYRPIASSITSGQVLMRDYSFDEGELIIKEMMDLMCLEMVEKGVVTKSITIYVGYSNSLSKKGARGTTSFDNPTNSPGIIIPAVAGLYRKIVDSKCPVRRMNISCNNVSDDGYEQIGLFDTAESQDKNHRIQDALIKIKKQFGRNAVFKGMDLNESATTIERNRQIGGHKSGEET